MAEKSQNSMIKYRNELQFWADRYTAEKGTFHNAHYERYMLAMAGQADDAFLTGKVVADFGCGPRGSLAWVRSTGLKFGIDVLAGSYMDLFGSTLLGHGMIYLKCTERHIPMPADSVDVLFSMNSLDHVDDFGIFRELVRVLRPGGLFCGSFNLNEPASACEPQCLTIDMIRSVVMPYFRETVVRVADKGEKGAYDRLMAGQEDCYSPEKEQILWFRGVRV